MADTKFCADCGEQINARAEICPKCGVRQASGKSNKKLIIIILLVLFGGFAAYIGISASIAAKQMSEYKIKGFNSAAASDLRNARSELEAEFADNNKYPDKIEDLKNAKFFSTIIYKKIDNKNYVITAFHEKGSKSYMTKSGSPDVFVKDKNASDDSYVKW